MVRVETHLTIYGLQQELAAQNRRMVLREARFRSFTANISAGIVIHDAETRIVMNNPAAGLLLDLSELQMRGKEAVDPEWAF